MANVDECIVSGQIWDDYCDALKRVGRHLLREEAPNARLTLVGAVFVAEFQNELPR